MIRPASALALLLWAAGTTAQADPSMVVADARARVAAGDPAGALAKLEAWLSRDGKRLTPGDQAALHLEAARHAAAAADRDRAAHHVDAAAQLGAVFRTDPGFDAHFRRELARVWERLGAFGAAEPLLSAALAAWPVADPAGAAEAASALGTAQLELRQPSAAAGAYRRSLALLRRAGAGAQPRVTGLVNLATAALQADERSAAVEAVDQAAEAAGSDPALRRAIAFARAQLLIAGPDLPGAEALLRSISEEADASDPVRGHALFLLASTRFDRGRMPEAAQAGLAAAAAYRESLGDSHPALARTLHLLGATYGQLRDRTSAARFLDRAVKIGQHAFGPLSLQVQATEMEWAWVELQGGDLAGAERRMMAIAAALAPPARPDPRTAGLAQLLAGWIAEMRGRLPEAVDHYRAGQLLIAQARTAGEGELKYSLVRLGRLLTRMGRLQEAAAPLDQAVANYGRLGSAGTARMADALVARAELRAARGDRRGALDEGRQAQALLRGGLDLREGGAFRRGTRDVLAAYARLLVRLNAADPTFGPGLLDEAFAATQEALASRAGEALRQATLRQAAGGGPLAALLREHTEATEALLQLDVLERAAAQREGVEAARETTRLRTVRAVQAEALATLDARLEREMPGFGAYARPRPVRLRAVQERLAPDDAVIATLTTADGLLLWTVTREGARLVPLQLVDAEVGTLVQRVRAGVDLSRTPFLPPFDIDAARRLYRALIDPAEDLLAGKRHLFFVPDGALQSLSPALLIGGETQDWLVRRFAVTVMPSLELLASSGGGPGSRAVQAFLGVGDPQMPGKVARRIPLANHDMPPDLLDALTELQPLPETRAELERIAGLFPENETRLVLGHAATKAGLAVAEPGIYRILAFATHAVMAGELPGIPEPAIVLTPSETDLSAGMLTASDVAAMRLDADLVMLSACNTAAPDGGPYAEGLSGLARAFLHAGTRSLLVSHWAVNSLGTIELTTKFMAAFRADPAQRKAEALRSAMLALLDGPDPQLRNPAIWAPFVLVGK